MFELQSSVSLMFCFVAAEGTKNKLTISESSAANGVEFDSIWLKKYIRKNLTPPKKMCNLPKACVFFQILMGLLYKNPFLPEQKKTLLINHRWMHLNLKRCFVSTYQSNLQVVMIKVKNSWILIIFFASKIFGGLQ